MFTFLLSTFILTAQEIKDQRLVIVKNQESLFKVEVAVFPFKEYLHPQRIYASYESEQIFEMQGAVRAHPLNGRYQAYDLDNHLLMEGIYSYGLRSGGWKQWDTKGVLLNHHCWKDGILDGAFREYDKKGSLVRSGQYRKGKLHGKIFVYNQDGLVQKLRYKKGNPIAPKKNKSKKNKKETNKTPVTSG